MKKLLDRMGKLFSKGDQVRLPEPHNARVETVRLSNPWHAVTIVPGPKRCPAVTAIMNTRFLSREAPSLPLKECTEPACSCRYRHHDDRRFGDVTFNRDGMALTHPKRRNSD